MALSPLQGGRAKRRGSHYTLIFNTNGHKLPMNYHEYSTCRLVLPRQPKAATFLDKPSASILGPAEGFAIDVNEDEKTAELRLIAVLTVNGGGFVEQG